MPTASVAGTEEGGYLPGEESVSAVPLFTEILADQALGSRSDIEAELDAMMRAIRVFYELEPDEVMQISSAYTARLTEIYVHLHRVEGRQREWRQVRTQQVVPILTELDRQHKRASRELEVRKLDLERLRGVR